MEFRVLGSVEVRDPDGARVPSGGRRQRAVLCALLLSEGTVVSVDRLAALVWGTDLPADPRAAVQTCISRLRRALPEGDRLRSADGGYRMELGGALFDLDRFRELVGAAAQRRRERDAVGAAHLLRDALDLWRGEPLADLGDLPLVAAASERLTGERLSALEDRVAADLESGAHRAVVDEVQQLVADHPLRERLHMLLMLALYRDGRQAEALQVYQRARELLTDELGIEPGADLQAMHEQILRQAPELDPADVDARPRHNLPHPVTTFVGHEDDLEAVTAMLREVRLVSLTGTGGTGKTRLAREVAARLLGDHPDGVRWVELAGVTNPDLVARQVADALGLVLQGGSPVVPALIDRCRDRRLLLVLDNCEHLLDAVAELVGTLQRGCEHLRVLATSREPLALEGEHVWRVPPLTVPRSDADRQLAEGLLAHSSVELFCERARAVDPTFALTAENAGAVAGICAQLDGLPLAIELTVPWVRTLTCAQLADRLASSSEILNAARRGPNPRHKTLTATLDWSGDLLEEAERAALRRLAVFVGGFDLDSAAAVIGSSGERSAAELVARLHTCSLVADDQRAGRFRLLEPVRQYALRKLEAAGEAAEARDAHARWQRRLAVRTEAQLRNDAPSIPAAIAELDREHGELRAALDWSIRSGRADLALGLAGHLWIYWWSAGHMIEGIDWLDRAVALPGDPSEDRAKALTGLAFLTSQDFRWDLADVHARAALAMFGRLSLAGPSPHRAYALFMLGEVLTHRGRYDESQQAIDEGLALIAASGDGWGYGCGTWGHADLAFARGDLETAHRVHNEMLATMRQAGNPVAMVAALHSLGLLELSRGRHAEARRHLEECLELRRSSGADRLGRYHGSTASDLRDLASAALAEDDRASAQRYALEGLEVAIGYQDDEVAAGCRHLLGELEAFSR